MAIETTQQRVEKRLKEAQKNKDFKDTNTVNYTKKYKRSYEVVRVNDLDELELDEINAFKQVEKAKVWLPYDLQEQKDKGYSSGATYLKVKCREALQNRPFDSKDARDVYVKNISKLQTILDACTNAEQVEKALYEFIVDKDFYGAIKTSSYSDYRYVDYKKLETIIGKRFINFCKRASDAAAADYRLAQLYDPFAKEQEDKYVLDMTTYNLKVIETQKQALERAKAIAGNEFELLRELTSRYSGSGLKIKEEFEKDKDGLKKIYLDGFEYRLAILIDNLNQLTQRKTIPAHKMARSDNWDWAFTEKEKREKKTSTTPQINTKPPLSHIVRTGGLKIPEIKVDSVVKYFCFNNVVFGNALDDKFSKESVKHFLGALTDLAEILDVDICKINQLGKLDINFATMGTKGHMAAYFPTYKAINLTKSSGDGSVAHEWFHYFDNIIQEGSDRRATYSLASEVVNSTDVGVRGAIYQLRKYIQNGDGENETVIVRFEAQDKYKFHIYGDTAQEAIGNIQRMYPTYTKAGNRKSQNTIRYFGYLAHKFNLEYVDVPMKLNSTRYYYNSLSIGTEYWVKPAELFARAFEAYIEVILDLKDRKNNYLVSFDWAKEYNQNMPYPQGKELEKIVLLFDNIFKEFKREFEVGDFNLFTNEREDEYVEISQKENKSVDKVDKPKTEPKDKKQSYIDKIEIYKEMIAEISDESKKQVYLDKIETYEEMLNELT